MYFQNYLAFLANRTLHKIGELLYNIRACVLYQIYSYRFQLELVYPMQHGHSFCKYYLQHSLILDKENTKEMTSAAVVLYGMVENAGTGSGYRVLGSGYWVPGTGYRVLGSGYWVYPVPVTRYPLPSTRYPVPATRYPYPRFPPNLF